MAAAIFTKSRFFARNFALRSPRSIFRSKISHQSIAGLTVIAPRPLSRPITDGCLVNGSWRWRLYCTVSAASRQCWQCAEIVVDDAAFLCDSCGVVQPVSSVVDHFALFGLERSYDVDLGRLTRAFRRLQGRLHPDKFAAKSEHERHLSSECSSLLNVAYQTLHSPYERGTYLMRLSGRALGDTGGAPVDPQLLADVMDINEQLAADELTAEDLGRLDADNKRIMSEIVPQLTEAFRLADLDLAENLLAKLKFFANIDTKIRSLELKFNIVH